MTQSSSHESGSSAEYAGDPNPQPIVKVVDVDVTQYEIGLFDNGLYYFKSSTNTEGMMVAADNPIDLFNIVEERRVYGNLNLHDPLMAAMFAAVFKHYAEEFSGTPLFR